MEARKEGIGRWADVSDDDSEDQLDRPLPPRIDEKGDLRHRLLPRRIAEKGDLRDPLLPPSIAEEDRLLPARIAGKGDLRDPLLLPPRGPGVLVGPYEKGHHHGRLPPPVVTGPDKDGVKTTVDYRVDDLGNLVKVTRRARIVRKVVPKRVAAAMERRSWAKFGDAAQDGDESPLTFVSRDPIYFPPRASAGSTTEGTALYVPPRRSPAVDMARHDGKVAVSVSNLSLTADETDVEKLFVVFGQVRWVSISKDSRTGRSKGSAVVSFAEKDEAKSAIDALDGYPYDSLLLQVGWAA